MITVWGYGLRELLRNIAMSRFLFTILVAFPLAVQSDTSIWQPPEDPDPQLILDEARQDRQAGRYQQSLDKHVWYHENALKFDRALYGVRLSFALDDWRQLANRYAPALEKMREIRDRAEYWVRENKDDSDAFLDFVALNSELKDEEHTVYLFMWLDENEPEFAELVFAIARDTLIAEGEFELCGKYIGNVESFRAELKMMADTEALMRKLGDAESVEKVIESQRRYAAYSMTADIAALVRIGRSEEAREAGRLLLQEFQDEAVRMIIEKAVIGEFPDPEIMFPSSVE